MITIVGAGAAGLSLGVMLDGKVTIYEQNDTPGGLCRSTVLDGFTFDTGPHILGGIPEAVDWIVESTGIEFVEGRTRNVGWYDGEYLTHPFDDPALGERYMAKMWKTDPAAMSVGGLVVQPGRKPGGVSTFRYPAKGGYQAITDAWARRLDGAITYRTRLDLPDYPDTVWTGPVRGGRYNTLGLVTAGFEGTAPDLTAIYLPGPETPFHRLSFPSAFAPANAPDGCFSVQCELSACDGRAETVYQEALPELLDRLGITRGATLFEHAQVVPHAYPVPVAGVPFSRPGIFHGRTGGFRYLNLDGVVAASMALAARLTVA